MLNEYCRKYRLKFKATLKDVEGSDQIKTLSAFEMGRSSNIKHLEKYIAFSVRNNDYDCFMLGIINELERG